MTLNGILLILRQTLASLRRDGPRIALTFLSINLRRKAGDTKQTIHLLQPRGVSHPVRLRSGRGDIFFFAQIFIDQEFAPTRPLDIATVVDLGGNIGLASVWFLNAFPRAQLVTIEANSDNYRSLEANLEPYGSRSVIVKGGVWWRRAPLTLVRRQNEGDAQVRETTPQDGPEGRLEGWDVPALMERGGFSSIDLLKIDIEGAEVELFAHGAERWLPHVRNLSIELHGAECEAALDRALQSYDFQKTVRGELTFCTGLRPRSKAQ